MAASDLVFESLPKTNPAELLFGETAAVADASVVINGTLPALTFSAQVGRAANFALNGTLPQLTLQSYVATRENVSIAGVLPALTLVSTAAYASNTARPTVCHVENSYETANKVKTGVENKFDDGIPTPTGFDTTYSEADVLTTGAELLYRTALKNNSPPISSSFQEAAGVPTWAYGMPWEEADRRIRYSRKTSYQEAIDSRVSTFAKYQEMIRDRRVGFKTRWKSTVIRRNSLFTHFQTGARTLPFWLSKVQEAEPPDGNNFVPPVDPPEPPPPCYIISPDLVFQAGAANNDTQLLFFCETYTPPPTPTTVVVPIRSVYVVINNISLRRVVGNIALPTLGLSLSIDADSWTWGFNASLPAETLDELQPVGGSPVELEADINGNLYRLLVEQISRERSFANSSIRISGRGKTALLSSPYAPVLTFANTQQRTAQQLMSDVLSINGIPLAWTIDWQLTDWLVPAGVFNVTGTYIDGLTKIAGAAGAYLQPDPVNQEISVLLKYPVVPWEWNTVTPDFELPASVTVQEGIRWLDKPEYNRVYVSGTSAGVLGQVTRAGTGGTFAAPMVTDSLITHADAARQRGIAVLGDTGRQALVQLRLPVLPETGVITPGKFVEYVDGAETRLGLVRSTSIDAGWPEVWQSIELETHL